MREIRLIRECIEKLSLDLSGLNIFTEAASGYYAFTPIIALMAGAKNVLAIAKDSRFGKKEDIKENIEKIAGRVDYPGKLQVVFDYELIHEADIITNCGFVRPISKELISNMKKEAAISLMWETWEFREDDLDLQSCIENQILVLGTNEHHPALQIFKYVGLLAKKLLFELDIEVFRSKILIAGGGDFAKEIFNTLKADGAVCRIVSPEKYLPENLLKLSIADNLSSEESIKYLRTADALVFADHQSEKYWLGGNSGISADTLKEINPDIKIAHISGMTDAQEIHDSGIAYKPARIADKPKLMSAATDYTGPRPLIELHTGGLKVGEVMAKARRSETDYRSAKTKALENPLCMDFSDEQIMRICTQRR